ncbi:MAG: sugar transferase [Ardenticatenaceae bacterium]|nr:sugar transferase [Ardenticatenaceae bacterium]MCB9442651.1 sugar transferase [Ardenticatenaceae bacterium]
MQVILIATGETVKLRPLTETITSPMIPVANRPIMVYTIEMLARQDYKQILSTLYHLGGSIEAYFGNGERWGVNIEYVLQKDAWGTAGTLKWAENSINETFLVLPGDVLIDLDIKALLARHRARQSMATVVVQRQGMGDRVCLDAADRVIHEAASTGNEQSWCNTGVYLFEPEILNKIPARTSFDLSQDLIPGLLAEGLPVHAYKADGYWNEMATFTDYHAAQCAYLHEDNGSRAYFDDVARVLETRQIADGIWVGRNHVIHPSVRLAPPVYIGDNCQIGRNVEIGPDVVIGKNVVIDDEATIFQSTILDQSYVGQLVNIENRVVYKNLMIDTHTAERTEVVDEFLLGEAHPALIDTSLKRIFDVGTSLFLLLLALPFMLLIGLVTLLTTGRLFESVVYVGTLSKMSGYGRSPRLESFTLQRFCTRRSGKLTAFGRWLEKWDMHRLPELGNVLSGKLSLVGVKPLLPEEVQEIREDWQMQRYEYQSGFTGLWYVQNGCNSQLDETLITDTYYVATRTWREDLKILRKTPAGWLKRGRN